MSLTGKKTRDPSNLPTLSYEIPLKLPSNVDSQPQEISFLDLIANDTKFKNDKESLELVLSSYVKACGKQSVKEILAEHDNSMDEKTSLADIIRVLMDYNDQQNADLGVGYNDPDDDDSFIDDSTAAQDIVPRNMKNEREGFYVNEKHQPIQARYVSESSDDDSDDDDDGSDDSDDSDDDDDDDDDSESSKSGKEDQDPTKKNKLNLTESIDKEVKKRKLEEEPIKVTTTPTVFLNAKRKRSVSEAAAPSLLAPIDDKMKMTSITDEPVKKVKKLSETSSESSAPNLISSVLPNELESDIKPIIDKLVKLIVGDQSVTLTLQKKIERLYDPSVSRELLDLAKKLQRHTNANRQLVFDVFGARTSICASLLVTRARLLLLNDYEPVMGTLSLNDLKEKLKVEVHKSLETHIQAHNQAVKDWQQKMVENPPKEKIRGPRKNFRFHKNINELIIRCVDRQLETMTMLDMDSLELFLQNHIVPLWNQTGWITAKKIITEVIRMEYRPLRDINPMTVPSATMITPPLPRPNTSQSPVVTNPSAQQITPPRTSTTTSTPTAERMKKDSPTIVSPMPKSVPTQSSPRPPPAQSSPRPSTTQSSPRPPSQSSHSNRPTDSKSNEVKISSSSSTNSSQNKPLEMATRVSSNTTKTPSTSRPVLTETIHSQISDQLLAKHIPSDIIRTVAKPVIVSPNPVADSSTKRLSTQNPSNAIDLTMDLLGQYKKYTQDPPSNSHRSHSQSSSQKDSSHHHRTSSSSSSSSSHNHSHKQQQQPSSTQYSAKNSIDKSAASSLLKEALLTTTGTTPTVSTTKTSSSPKVSSSASSSSSLTVDSMLSKPMQSPKPSSNTSSSSMKTSSIPGSPTTNSSQRSSSSTTKISSSHHRSDQQSHQPKSHSSSSSSSSNPHRHPSTATSSSSSSTTPSSSARRSTPVGLGTGFNATHDSQSLRNLSSQLPIPSALSQSLQWDPATIQLAAAALANPQLLNSSVFDTNLFNSVFGAAPNLISSSGSSSSPSSSRHSQSQNNSNQRRS